MDAAMRRVEYDRLRSEAASDSAVDGGVSGAGAAMSAAQQAAQQGAERSGEPQRQSRALCLCGAFACCRAAHGGAPLRCQGVGKHTFPPDFMLQSQPCPDDFLMFLRRC